MMVPSFAIENEPGPAASPRTRMVPPSATTEPSFVRLWLNTMSPDVLAFRMVAHSKLNT
jgi:hypothetical protein